MPDSLRLYLDEIGTTPLLTPDQERELGSKAKAGDQSARETLIKSNLRLVVKIAQRYRGCGLDMLDLVCEGNIGLIRAVDEFDPEKFGNKFSTYAAWWIKKEIRKALMSKCGTVRLPEYVVRKAAILMDAKEELEDALGREPTASELAEKLKMPEDIVAGWMHSFHVGSLDAMAEMPGEHSPASSEPCACDCVAESDEHSTLLSLMAGKLDEREMLVVSMRYGLNGYEAMKLEEIGACLIPKVTYAAVGLILKKALKKLSFLKRQLA